MENLWILTRDCLARHKVRLSLLSLDWFRCALQFDIAATILVCTRYIIAHNLPSQNLASLVIGFQLAIL